MHQKLLFHVLALVHNIANILVIHYWSQILFQPNILIPCKFHLDLGKPTGRTHQAYLARQTCQANSPNKSGYFALVPTLRLPCAHTPIRDTLYGGHEWQWAFKTRGEWPETFLVQARHPFYIRLTFDGRQVKALVGFYAMNVHQICITGVGSWLICSVNVYSCITLIFEMSMPLMELKHYLETVIAV